MTTDSKEKWRSAISGAVACCWFWSMVTLSEVLFEAMQDFNDEAANWARAIGVPSWLQSKFTTTPASDSILVLACPLILCGTFVVIAVWWERRRIERELT